jgi:hypothetical protein
MGSLSEHCSFGTRLSGGVSYQLLAFGWLSMLDVEGVSLPSDRLFVLFEDGLVLLLGLDEGFLEEVGV